MSSQLLLLFCQARIALWQQLAAAQHVGRCAPLDMYPQPAVIPRNWASSSCSQVKAAVCPRACVVRAVYRLLHLHDHATQAMITHKGRIEPDY